MKMKLLTNISAAILGLCPVLASAQTIEMLDVVPASGSAQLQAEIDLQGKEIEKVTAVAYSMKNGYSVETSEDYILEDGRYIAAVAQNAAADADNAYMMKVTFTDGTSVYTDCMLPNKETFRWLTELQWTAAQPGYGKVEIDQGIDGGNAVNNGIRYYKLIACHADGYVTYGNIEGDYTRFETKIGVSDGGQGSYGDVRFMIYANDVLKKDQLIYSNSNPDKGNNLSIDDVSFSMEGVTKLHFKFGQYDNNWSDHSYLLLPRLYLPMVEKEAQTVTMVTDGGKVADRVTSIDLQATTSASKPVHYVIAEGKDLAEIRNGNQLVLYAGKKGKVVVQAFVFGDESHYAGVSSVTFDFDLTPKFEYLGEQTLSDGNTYAYFIADPCLRTISGMQLSFKNNPDLMTNAGTLDVLPYLIQKDDKAPWIAAVPKSVMPSDFFRIEATFADEYEETDFVSDYYDGGRAMVFGSDLPVGSYVLHSNYNSSTSVDQAVSMVPINLAGTVYPKGFGVHAVGYATFNLAAGKYDRFVAHVGKQSGRSGNIEFVLSMNGTQIATTGSINQSKRGDWDYPVAADITTLRIDVKDGGDNIGSDHGSMGGVRFYYTAEERQAQNIEWKSEKEINGYKPFDLNLDAVASSGLPVFYKVVEGRELASVEGNVLHITQVPEGVSTIKVAAYQPGNLEWGIAPEFVCTMRLNNAYVVERDATLVLENGETLGELTVYADQYSAGQVRVKGGLATVKKLNLKYTFYPQEYTFVTFPTDMNLDKVGNLAELGFPYSSLAEGKSYTIYAYDTFKHAETPDGDNWTPLPTADVKGGKGYVVRFNGVADNEPVEATFVIENSELKLDESLEILNLTVDFGDTEPGTMQTLYVRPQNVSGNTLRIDVKYDPTDLSDLPVNHERALRDARVTFVPGFSGIRLTLPDNTPAKVAIYDASGKHLKKAVRYVSPMMINIEDLKPGEYQMIVSYGNAIGVKTFVKPKM